ncbi:hypothetical protein BPNPMPFG_005634 [Mesorhizobium sp. AR07]|uniref:hypothetical protein n=1 Tax=Mesorhizobium sp. AR07 TaxID=2865838 RepID=UPI00215DF5B8|nr:hypothetical protein [Mesorhizobium sp. AR07]UVK43794.1 hypothetical protein BPNPMPFG_005634 [Mesorhizobium sp. AR07]
MADLLQQKKLSAFIEACLDPLPAAILVDTAYNSTMRHARWNEWRKARRLTEAYRAVRDLAEVFWHGPLVGLEAIHSAIGDRHQLWVERYRAAVAVQILTPAPDQVSVKWKKQAAKDRYLPISSEQIAQAIAEDEAWLAAHPTTKEPRKTRGSRCAS